MQGGGELNGGGGPLQRRLSVLAWLPCLWPQVPCLGGGGHFFPNHIRFIFSS